MHNPSLSHLNFFIESLLQHTFNFSWLDSFLILDLPKLQTLSFSGDWVLAGDWREEHKTIINGRSCFDGKLVMRGMGEEISTLIANGVDLPSLTSLEFHGEWVFGRIGYVVLESMH